MTDASPGLPTWAADPAPPSEPLDPPDGGRYRPHAFHRPGGMGRVWLARDTELNRDVAVKEIRPRFWADDAARARFTFEAEVTGRLEHPSVIPVYGFGRDTAGRPFYAMRFVEGRSLQEAIVAFHAAEPGAARTVALRRLLAHFVTVCRAVDYAHSRGVIHRDLKPQNVMVGDFGETLVVDWGIAKRLRAAEGEPAAAPAAEDPPPGPGELERSLRGTRLGTPAYWSPEQATGRPDLHDERTDVYGLGAILFAILTGRPPHPTGKHASEPPSPRAHSPWLDEGIDAIVRTATAVDPAARYRTAGELAQAVELWLADQPLLAQRGVVAALARAADADPADATLAEQFARQRSNLGLMLAGMGRDADAVTEFRAAADVFARLAAADDQPRFAAERAGVLRALARAYSALGKPDVARAREQEAADLYRRLVLTRPDVYKPGFEKVMMSSSEFDLDHPGGKKEPASDVDFDLQLDQKSHESDASGRAPKSGKLVLDAESDSEFELNIEDPPSRPPGSGDLAPPGETGAPEHIPLALPVSSGEIDISLLPNAEAISFAPAAPQPSTEIVLDFSGPGPGDSGRADEPPAAPAPLPADAPDPGPLVIPGGGYAVLRDLARGGMGRLHVARDQNFDRLVVVKTLADRHLGNPRAAARFRREVQITGLLEHPNVVRAYASGVAADGRPYLVLEYLNGPTLQQLLEAQGPGWSAALLDPLAQACDGAHYAHLRGVVHRDAKLANIVVLPLGRTVLLDWGLAKRVGVDAEALDVDEGEADGDATRSRAGKAVGTPAYMSPEQAFGGRLGKVGPRSDVFTLGVDLYHLVTGLPPGHQEDVHELLARRRGGNVPRLRDVRPDVPPELDAICARATATRPQDRHPTAAALAEAVRAFLASPARGS